MTIDPKTAARFSGWVCVTEAVVLHRAGPSTLPLAIRCWLGTQREPIWSLWDTGATWSVIGPSLVEDLSADLGPPGSVVTLKTRDGAKRGELRSLRVGFEATEGRSLAVDATVLALIDPWSRPPVLGLLGLMERVRFAVDLGRLPEESSLVALAPL